LARRNYPGGHRVRRLAWLTLIITGIEGALGAGLVQFEQVADNAELSRAFWISGHLVNTLVLLAIAFATAWFASNPDARFSAIPGLIWFGIGLFMLVGISGAITALGDTLFPSDSFFDGLEAEMSATASLFERLRVAHPIIAVGSSLAVIAIVRARDEGVTRSGRQLTYLLLAQLGVGVVNVLLAAPIWMQVVHLLVADAVWLLFVRYGLEASVLESERVPA
jgi:heme A synthase